MTVNECVWPQEEYEGGGGISVSWEVIICCIAYPPQDNVRVLNVHVRIVVRQITDDVVEVVHQAADQRDHPEDHDPSHVLLHRSHLVLLGRPQPDEGGQDGQTPHVLPPEWIRYLEFLDFQDEDVQFVQDVSGQLGQHHEEQQVVEHRTGLEPGFVQDAERESG